MLLLTTYGGAHIVVNQAHVKIVRPYVPGPNASERVSRMKTEIVMDCRMIAVGLEGYERSPTEPHEYSLFVANPFYFVAASLGAREVGV